MRSKSSDPVENGFRNLSRETVPDSHLTAMLAGSRRKLQRRKLMKQRIRRISWGATAVVAILIALLAIPISFDVKVGSVITVENIPLTAGYTEFQKEVPSLDGLINSSLSRNTETATLQLAFTRSGAGAAPERIRNLLDRFDLSGDRLVFSSRDIMKKVGGNALAAITGGYIHLNVTDMRDAEIESALLAELAAAGLEGGEVQIETDTDGIKHIEMSFEAPVGEGDGSGEYTIEITSDENGEAPE